MEKYLPLFMEVDKEYKKIGRESATIENLAFTAGIGITNNVLESANVKHCLYGGAALQLHLYSSIKDKKLLSHVLRATSDYDIAVREKDLDEIYEIFKDQELILEGEGYIFEGNIRRNAKKRIMMEVYGGNDSKEYEIITTITFITDNILGEKMMEDAINYENNIEGIKVKVKISPPEYILAGKLERMNPYRDIPDIYNILSFLPLDWDKLVNSVKTVMEYHTNYRGLGIIMEKLNNKEELMNYLWKLYKASF